MKKLLIITLLSFLFVGSTFAQGFSAKPKTSKAKTTTAITIDGKMYQHYTTKSNSVCIIIGAKKKYLGKDTGKTYTLDGKTFKVFKTGKATNKNGVTYRYYYHDGSVLKSKSLKKD